MKEYLPFTYSGGTDDVASMIRSLGNQPGIIYDSQIALLESERLLASGQHSYDLAYGAAFSKSNAKLVKDKEIEAALDDLVTTLHQAIEETKYTTDKLRAVYQKELKVYDALKMQATLLNALVRNQL